MELNLKQLASYTDSLVEPEIAVELIAVVDIACTSYYVACLRTERWPGIRK